jgi:hypothetical protein
VLEAVVRKEEGMRKNYKDLKVGDKIKLVKVPKLDIEQRKRECHQRQKGEWTADTLEKIIASNPIVTISKIDESGKPWFDCNLKDKNGVVESHSIMIFDNDSWDYYP